MTSRSKSRSWRSLAFFHIFSSNKPIWWSVSHLGPRNANAGRYTINASRGRRSRIPRYACFYRYCIFDSRAIFLTIPVLWTQERTASSTVPVHRLSQCLPPWPSRASVQHYVTSSCPATTTLLALSHPHIWFIWFVSCFCISLWEDCLNLDQICLYLIVDDI